ncbi:MAG: hypothetical protein V3V99_05305 [candidate division Zixibacteria bacterium]
MKAAIINSRQSAYPVGDDLWVQKTLRAVEYLAGRQYTIVTSIGLNTWELVLALASQYKAEVNIIMPAQKYETGLEEKIINDFKLDSKRVWFLKSDELIPEKRQRLLSRDKAVIDLADILVPISIRPSGNMVYLLDCSKDKIFSRYQIPYQKSRRRPSYKIIKLNPELSDGKWLVHFTRSGKFPWPGLTSFEFYHSMISSGKEYCQSAHNVLVRILESRIIRASNNNIADGSYVVGFSNLINVDPAEIFRYRSRLVNPYFEPYGLAISTDYVSKHGISPVIYGDRHLYDTLDGDKRSFFQSRGKKNQWVGENEWRHIGDFVFDNIPPDHLRIIVPNQKEVNEFQAMSSIPVIPLDFTE